MDFSSMLSSFRDNADNIAAAAAEAEASRRRTAADVGRTSKRPRTDGASPNDDNDDDDDDDAVAVAPSLPTTPVRVVYVVCPARQRSGGPEAMHQLCDRLNDGTNDDEDEDEDDANESRGPLAYMLYLNENRATGEISHVRSPSATPDVYRSYDCPPAPTMPSDADDELVVWPECWTHLAHHFVRAQVCVWWLSVDNNHGRFTDFRRRPDILHLYQSRYARSHLLRKGAPPANVLPMTEYIPASRVPPPGSVDTGLRDHDVLYNPSKGVHYTDLVRDRCAGVGFRPIGGGRDGRHGRIDPEEVTSLLLRSKVYIDFGHHPGMDRLPREAALCGCVVITNREGAAGFADDVPIPDEYRIRTFDVDVVHDLLRRCLDEHDVRRRHFDEYREWIGGQYDRMQECVRRFKRTVIGNRRQAERTRTATTADGDAAGGVGGHDDDEVRSYGNAKNDRRGGNDDSSIGSDNDETWRSSAENGADEAERYR